MMILKKWQGQAYIDLHYASDHIEDYQEIVNVSQPLLPWDEEGV